MGCKRKSNPMTTSKEEIKDWIRYGLDHDARYMFIIKDEISFKLRPYWARAGENVEVLRTMITEGGGNIVNELNMDVKLLFLKDVK